MDFPEKHMTFLIIGTDMGISEICGLQWKFVNLTSQETSIDGQLIPPRTIAVRRQWYRGLLTNVATGRGRNLPMSDATAQMLTAIKAKSKFTNPEDFVLTSRVGTPINQTNVATRRLQPVAKKLQLPNLSWQLFRRTRKALVVEFGLHFQEVLSSLLTTTLPEVSTGHHTWHCRVRRPGSHSKDY